MNSDRESPDELESSSTGEPIFRRRRPQGENKDEKESEESGTEGNGFAEQLRNVPERYRRVVKQLENEASLLSVSDTGITVSVKKRKKLPKLPPGYFFKGGVAREHLRLALHPQSAEIPFRDLDIIRFISTDDRQDHQLSLRYMSDDYEFGRGVEVNESRENYFRSRDITVNEVLFTDSTLECSYVAVEDSSRNILRPTSHVKNSEGGVNGSTVMKMIRLTAEALIQNVQLEILEVPDSAKASPFEIAVHLDRSLEGGKEIAEEYILSAWQRDILMSERGAPPSVSEAVTHLSRFLPKGAAFFRNLPPDTLREVSRQKSVK